MAKNHLRVIEKKIGTLQRRLLDVGNMRPGTLSVQYRHPAEKKSPFNQISYTFKGKSRSEYVRAENLETIKREINAYQRFKSIVDELIDLSIQASRIRSAIRSARK